ncbi:MAG: BlaI/MecI/CopY family transcriptional regulator [Terriglobia bacterium]
MLKPKKTVPTGQELTIMKVLWQRGSATVREVYEELRKQRQLAYTTVLTMMGILEHKGYVKKTAGARAYIYSPKRPQMQVVGGLVNDFVSRVFDGSAKPLLVHLIESRDLSAEELDELRKLLREKRGRV